jgi:hypothetical protein
MTAPSTPRRALPRRLILAAAVVAGLVAALALAQASPPRVPAGHSAVVRVALVSEALAQSSAPTPPAAPSPPAGTAAPANADPGAGPQDRAVDTEISIDHRGVRVRKGTGNKGDAHVVVGDQDFESFEQFVEQAPWLAALVFTVTALVFIVPLLAIVLLVWYKMRRTRMMNETMIKLAERGAVAPADAMAAVANGRSGAALQNLPPTAPLYEQAKALRKGAAWSDLRKGVLIGGVGLGLTLWPMLEGDTANGFGLVLLFVGIGYTVLWYLEERPGRGVQDRAGSPPGAA